MTTTTMSDNTLTVREFSSHDVNFLANDDLSLELRKGGNTYAGYAVHSDQVLVTINVDDCGYSNVQVSARHSGTYLAAIETSIEKLIVARDQLRKMAATA